MLLRPRKFIYKNIFKRRSIPKVKNQSLLMGSYGLRLVQPLRLTSKHIFRIKLFLKKSSRKYDITVRRIWFNIFPHLPLSKKIKGSRMGKGSGKLVGWFTELPSGICIFEFKNLRTGRASYFAQQIKYRLAAKSEFIKYFHKKSQLPLNPSKQIPYMNFW